MTTLPLPTYCIFTNQHTQSNPDVIAYMDKSSQTGGTLFVKHGMTICTPYANIRREKAIFTNPDFTIVLKNQKINIPEAALFTNIEGRVKNGISGITNLNRTASNTIHTFINNYGIPHSVYT